MKQRYFLLLASVILLAACTKETPDTPDKPQPPQGMAEVTLGIVHLNEAAPSATFGAEASATTRATTTSLTEGATLRLYAFKPGVTDYNRKLATRTYTVDATGTAIPDSGQDPLYLPIGSVDIYLAGPTTHNIGTVDTPNLIDVAGALGIAPCRDVDLIAAYTSVNIKPGSTNPLPAMTLVHKMAKVQVEISHNASGAYENLNVLGIKLYAQPLTGSYTLDTTGGAITPSTTADDVSIPTIVEHTLHEKYSGTMLLIPQAESELKIETTFECNQINKEVGDNHPTLSYRQSGLISAALTSGTATRFSAAPLTPIEIKWRTKVLPWNTVDQGEIIVPGVDRDMIACWDGGSALTGGDASGNGAVWTDLFGHKLTAIIPTSTKPLSTVTYNNAIKAITTTGPVYNNRGPKLTGNLDLGSYNQLSVEMIYECTSPYLNFILTVQDKSGGNAFFIRPNTGIYSLGLEFTCALGQFYYELGARAKEKSSLVYVLDGAGGILKIFYNGIQLPDPLVGEGKGEYTFPPTDKKFDLAKFILGNNGSSGANQAFIGNIHAVRVYSRTLTAAEVKKNYDKDKIVFDLP